MLYRQRSTFFYETRIKPAEKTISPFRKRTSEPGRTQKTKYAAVSRIPSEVAVGRRVQGSVKRNVFVKPNEQSRACASYAMARKRQSSNYAETRNGRKKFKAFSAVSPPLTDCRSERLSGLPLLSFTDRQNTPAYQLTTAAIYIYTPSDFRAAAPDRQSEPSPQSRVCRLASSGRELRTSPTSVVGL